MATRIFETHERQMMHFTCIMKYFRTGSGLEALKLFECLQIEIYIDALTLVAYRAVNLGYHFITSFLQR